MLPHRRRPVLLALTALAPLTLLACADPSPDPPPVAEAEGVRNAAGSLHVMERPFERGERIERIVSLVPSATEVIVALGAGDRLVGRTDFDTASALAALPSVGGGLGPSIEVLLSLEPDLVIRFGGDTDLATPGRLDDLDIPHLAVIPERVQDVRDMIGDLGALLGRAEAADSIVSHIDRELARVMATAAGLPPVRTAFLLGGSPPWAAGPDTYVGELIALAGGDNVFGDLGRPWSGVSPESLLARRVDVVLMLEGARLDPRLAQRLTVRHVALVVQLPGPRVHEAALAIARALHPEAFR
ncbi:MAG TPA: helical backbone metal receptor [Longimicrobiales bacterium]